MKACHTVSRHLGMHMGRTHSGYIYLPAQGSQWSLWSLNGGFRCPYDRNDRYDRWDRTEVYTIIYLPSQGLQRSQGSQWSLQSLNGSFRCPYDRNDRYDLWDRTEVYLSDRCHNDKSGFHMITTIAELLFSDRSDHSDCRDHMAGS